MTEQSWSASSPLVGRQFEQEQFAALLDRAAGGQAQTILIGGSAGVGKTTLVAATTSGRDATVASGGCLPLVSVTVPFMAIRAAVDSVPSVGSTNADGRTVVAGDEATVPVRFDGWLDQLCEQGPTVLVVEDVHWADQFTLDTLLYVIAGPASRPLAVVLTMRQDELGDGHRLQRWLAGARRFPLLTEVTLDPFDRLETAEQLALILGALPHQALVEDIFTRSGGNPLLIRLLAAGLTPDARHSAATFPSNVRSAVLHSWFGLPPRTRDAVTVLAVGSRPMRPSELAAVAEEDTEGLRSRLLSAVDAGVLESGPDGTFWFRHPLNAEVLGDAVPSRTQERWHARFAELLEAELADDSGAGVSAVAEHRFRAGDLPAAYRWALKAASFHDAEGAHAESVRMLRRGLALHELVHPTETVDDLLERIRLAAASAGMHEAELEAVDALLARTSAESEPGRVAALLVRRNRLLFSTGRAFMGLDDLRLAVRLSTAAPESPEHAMSVAELAMAELWHINKGGIEHARTAMRLALATGDDRALSAALSATAFAAAVSDDTATGRQFAREAFETGLRAGDWWACMSATFWEANCTDLGTSAQHLEVMSSKRGLLAEAGAPHTYIAFLAATEASSWLVNGAWQECSALLRETLASDPGVLGDTRARLVSALLAAWQGRQREAEQHMAHADELFAERSNFLAFEFDAVRAVVRLGAHDAEGAYRAALVGITVPDAAPIMCEWLLPLAARALADRALADRDARDKPTAVLALADELEAAYPRAIRDPGIAWPAYVDQCAAFDALYAAELSRARAEPAEGDLWVVAADLLRAGGLPWEETYACRRGADALLSHGGDRQVGAALLRRGFGLAEDLRAEPLLQELRALALRARISVRRAVASTAEPAAGAVKVTRREREILALLVSGRTYGEIAAELVISEKTVSSHISNLLAKTGTANRIDLAGYADRSGLVSG